MSRKLKVLFLCTGNSCRSQMAEGWARHLKADSIEAYSAGIETHGMNPRAVRVMAEAGVDISGVASRLGGGGHKQASGAMLPPPFETATQRVLDAIRQELQNS